MARIAIIGTEGTGKTTLMAVIARAFRRSQEGICLVPMSFETAKYVDDVWRDLERGRWPESTRRNTHFE